MARLTDSAPLCELLDSPVLAYVSTVGPQGRPQASVVWFERRGEQIVFFAETNSLKVRNLEHDPSIVLVVVDAQRELAAGTPAYVRLTGTAHITEGEARFPDKLAVAYGNEGGYPWPLRPFFNVTVTVTRISRAGTVRKPANGWMGDRRLTGEGRRTMMLSVPAPPAQGTALGRGGKSK